MNVNDCVCGHALDEHDRAAACEIPGCDCFHYEWDEEGAG